MKKLLIILIAFHYFSLSQSQIIVNPTSQTGSGYGAITSAGLELETPDCVHGAFGPHITQVYDDVLATEVFRFHSHIVEDNDRCEVFDRVRMEIKGGPGSSDVAQHVQGSESWYRWKFKLPSDFQGASSFCHIFQNKIKGGDDSGLPVITITPRTSRMEVIHRGGDSGSDLGKIVNTDLAPFLGNWIEVYIYQLHDENGKLVVQMKDLKTGNTLVDYSNDDIDLWREGAEYSRPKWGIYRSKAESLKDETVLFSNFCISEVEEGQCPPDDRVFEDTEPPTTPENLTVDKTTMTTAILSWDESTDNFGVERYIVYQDGEEVASGNFVKVAIEGLAGGSNYNFSVAARDAAGNESPPSEMVIAITDPADALPDGPFDPFPADLAEQLNLQVTLRWAIGDNTDSSLVFFGEADDLQLLSVQKENSFDLELDFDSTYYWQIGQKNINGVTLGPKWSFTTADDNADGPWIVYRGNERLDLETSALELRDLPSEPEVDQVLEDGKVPGNNIYQYFEDSDEKFRWRYSMSDADTAFTVVARIKAFPEAKNIGYFEVRLGGYRDKLRINHSSLKLEKSTPVIEEDYNFDWDADFHVIRVTMIDRVMKVYLDENPIPLVTGFSEEEDGGMNFEFGKSGGTPTGSFVDWMTILPNQAVGPGEGPDLPEDLIISNDASVASILVNGKAIEDFNPEIFEYEIDILDASLPTIVVNPNSELANYDISINEEDNEFNAVIVVTAQDQVNSVTYRLKLNKGVTSEWLVYRANARLDMEASYYELRDLPEEPACDMVVEDPNGSSNTFYKFQDDSDDKKFRWRYRFDEQDTAFTVVARIKGITPEVKNITFFEVRGFGWREKIKINHSTIKFERSEPLIELPYEFDFDAEFHLVRIIRSGNSTVMYLDEHPEPFATAISSSEDSNTYFEFGKLGGSECGAFVDWMTLLPNQAAAPGEGPALPDDLFLSSDAKLASISVGGELIQDFHPDSLQYTFLMTGATLPAIEYLASSDLATITLDTIETDTTITINIQVVAQDGFTSRTYELEFQGTSSLDQVSYEDKIMIYPNPSSNSFTIDLEEGVSARIQVINVAGQIVHQSSGIGQTTIFHTMKSGTYFVRLEMKGEEPIYKKLLIR